MKSRLIGLLGIVVVLILALQSFWIYRLSSRLEQMSRPAESNESVPSTGREKQPQKDLFDSFGDRFATWNPFDEMRRMQSEMNRLFQDSRSRFNRDPSFGSFLPGRLLSPDLDIEETDKSYFVRIDITGADPSSVRVELSDGVLSISAETREDGGGRDRSVLGGKALRRERFFGRFERSFALPGPVVEGKMATNYEDGVLTVTIPKAERDRPVPLPPNAD